jgi:hypothetical protein
VSLTMYVFWDHPSYRLLLSNAIMLIKKDWLMLKWSSNWLSETQFWNWTQLILKW